MPGRGRVSSLRAARYFCWVTAIVPAIMDDCHCAPRAMRPATGEQIATGTRRGEGPVGARGGPMEGG